jgi:hypothetical protein
MLKGGNMAFETFAVQLPADVRKAISGKLFDYYCIFIDLPSSDKAPLPV